MTWLNDPYDIGEYAPQRPPRPPHGGASIVGWVCIAAFAFAMGWVVGANL